MAEYAKKKNIRKPRPETIQHTKKENFKKPESKSKAEIVKEKSFVSKQKVKEAKKPATKSEKKDLDAAHKRVTGGGIHRGKKSKNIEVSTPKHPAHTKKGKKSNIIGKIKDWIKGDSKAKADESKIKPKIKKKPLSPEQKKKDKAIMKAEEARRAKSKSKAIDKAIMKAEKSKRAKAKEDMPTGRSSAASGHYKREEAGKRKGYKKHASKPSGKR